MLLGGRQSAAYWKKSLGGAFGILAEEVAGGRRGDREHPEDVVQQQGGDQQEDAPLLLVAPALDLVAPALDLAAPAVDLSGPALVRESEEQGEAVQGGAKPTGGIAPEKALGGTTGGGGEGRPSLG